MKECYRCKEEKEVEAFSTRSSRGCIKCNGDIIPSGTKGAIRELVVSYKLLSAGYSVFRSMSPNSPYDLVASKGGSIFRIEVRSRRPCVDGTMKPTTKEIRELDNGKYDLLVITSEGLEEWFPFSPMTR